MTTASSSEASYIGYGRVGDDVVVGVRDGHLLDEDALVVARRGVTSSTRMPESSESLSFSMLWLRCLLVCARLM